ncbi:methyltransferase domain-containing protein [Colletotrichum karsti]|uniref:Methyltransferase domain-containing protein n=1 Tax=Colletotrichum karsti TaxID=1095194 RepID=A0A9P6I377_9PEZI|nr:methyltransferase domain-containing protein [Colletotrichum karsti]KAF9873156.1 methyltransferase domain-containing protein [Colletotrichum karsti]
MEPAVSLRRPTAGPADARTRRADCEASGDKELATFTDLPPEIHLLISKQLIYPDALSLKHTNSYFYYLVDTGVRLKVEWLMERRMLHLECPNDKRCDLGSDLRFCRGSVPLLMQRRREHMEYLQHRIWIICFDGDLALNPGHKTAKRVLDIGTGTGLWAIDYADAFPSAEVVGVDLSPIQPGWTPPNCSFEIDDLEKEWTWTKPFDFIMCRGMAGCFADVPAMIQKFYDNLSPNGWFEIDDLALPVGCDDDTLTKDSAISRWHGAVAEASEKLGRPLVSMSTHLDPIKKAGFVDIGFKEYKWPLNSWPRDPKLKELGSFQCVNLDLGLEGLSLALLTRVLGWSKEEVITLCALTRKEIRDRKIHAYWRVHCVYARKPESTIDEFD